MSTKIILELIVTFSKIILLFLGKWLKAEMEERIRYHKKMTTLLDLLKEAAEDKIEIINEKDYLENLNWEEKTRYDMYKPKVLYVLSNGGSFKELTEIKSYGFDLRIKRKEKEVNEILGKNISNEDKAIQISKLASTK
jgi:hypothetical protein